MQNVLKKNQSYPELGYRIDSKGIAYDLQTNQPLSRQAVDARIAAAENADPTSDDYAARERKRGGLAGAWDRNKKVIKPIATGLAGFVGTPALAAALGAAMSGLDREGKGGIGFDAKQGLRGGLEGYAMGQLGNMAAGTGVGQKLGGGALANLNTTAGQGVKGELANLFMGKGAAAAPMAATAAPSATAQAAPALGPKIPMQTTSMGAPPMPTLPTSLPKAAAGGGGGWMDKLGSVVSGGLKTVGKAADWAEKHPVALKAGEGLVKGLTPPSDLEKARTAESSATAARTREQMKMDELKRRQREEAMAGNKAQRDALAAQLAALFASPRAPALSNYTPPAYNGR